MLITIISYRYLILTGRYRTNRETEKWDYIFHYLEVMNVGGVIFYLLKNYLDSATTKPILEKKMALKCFKIPPLGDVAESHPHFH